MNEVAPRSERIKLSRAMRLAYRNRPLTTDACRCLVNESLRNGHYQGKSPKAANPDRVDLKRGRPRIA